MPRYNPFKSTVPAKPEPLAKNTTPNPDPVCPLPQLKENEPRNGYEIHFNRKPAPEVLARLQQTKNGPGENRWRFHFVGKFWYAKRNEATKAFAAEICNPQRAAAEAVEHATPCARPPTYSLTNAVKEHDEEAGPSGNIVPIDFAPGPSGDTAPAVRTTPTLTVMPPAWRCRLTRPRGNNE